MKLVNWTNITFHERHALWTPGDLFYWVVNKVRLHFKTLNNLRIVRKNYLICTRMNAFYIFQKVTKRWDQDFEKAKSICSKPPHIQFNNFNIIFWVTIKKKSNSTHRCICEGHTTNKELSVNWFIHLNWEYVSYKCLFEFTCETILKSFLSYHVLFH